MTWRVGFIGLLTFAVLLCAARLGERSLWSEEVRWAAIPRHMAATGDYTWPAINGRTYYDKPLGSYWLVLAAAAVRGGVDETAARLPSAASAVVAVALVALLGRRLYGPAAGLAAGAVLATAFGFAVFARTASADMETLVGVLAAVGFAAWNEERRPGPWLFALWAVMAAASLTKGLLGFALPVLILVVYHALPGGAAAGWTARQRWLLNRYTPAALLLAAAVYAAPFLASGGRLTDGLAMVWRENVRRFFDAHNHRGPVWLYGPTLLVLAAPWSALLPAALLHAHRRREPGDRLALAWFWALLVFFTAASSRRSYYLLPILPAVALLVGRLIVTPVPELGDAVRRCLRAGLFLLGVGALAAAAALCPAEWRPGPWREWPATPAPLAFAAAWLVAAGGLLRAWRAHRLAMPLAAANAAAIAYLFLAALPAVERYRTQKPFLAEVRDRLGDDLAELVLYRVREPVYYLDPPAPLAEAADAGQLRSLIADGRRWVLLRQRDRAEAGVAGAVTAGEPVYPWESADARAGKLLLIDTAR